MQRSEEATRLAIREAIPVGTSLATAEAAMANAHYDCKPKVGQPFAAVSRSAPSVPHLECFFQKGDSFLVDRLWTVALVYGEDERISDV